VAGENVTNQKFRCEHLQKFKNFCLKLSAIIFPNQIASSFIILPLNQPIYKNIHSNYGKVFELGFSGFIWILFG
jgi:hypothetical protein